MNAKPMKTGPGRAAAKVPKAHAPTSVSAYRKWAVNVLGINHDANVRRWYEVNAAAARTAVEAHSFFSGLSEELVQAETSYRECVRVDLLMDRTISLVTKPFESFVDKSLRRNVLENQAFPKAPPQGWFTPETWFAANNDTVRTTLVCKYMDGPAHLAARLRARAKTLSLESRLKSQQNDDGYYAYHFYVRVPVELTRQDWSAYAASVEVEIQLTTQLQEVLRALTHRLYEVRRLATANDAHAWKWERQTSRFRAAYLGHTLHMLEAVILDLRDSGGSS